MVALIRLPLGMALVLAARAALAGPGDDFAERLVEAATAQTLHPARYDGSYRALAYPRGDVPADVGVCSDVVVRAYRALGIDLQVLVHADMGRAFSAYPHLWGLKGPDANIDHRRVPNLQAFLRRRHAQLPESPEAPSFRPGDLVTWMLPGNLPHIGLVSDRRTADGSRPLVVHNIGNGPEVSDVLFAYPITGHYRYRGDSQLE